MDENESGLFDYEQEREFRADPAFDCWLDQLELTHDEEQDDGH
jgi:hypothetical protein